MSKIIYLCKSQFNNQKFKLAIFKNCPSNKYMIVNLTSYSFWNLKFKSDKGAERRIYMNKNWQIKKIGEE